MPSHRLIHPDVEKLLASVTNAPTWPSYTGVSEFVGATSDGRCTVYYDPSLTGSGLQNALDLLADAPRIMKFNDDAFGTAGGHVDVIVFALGGMTDGTGGADHMGCDFTTGAQIEVCASFGRSDRVSALFEAELSECSMNNQLCGLSTGEALSRWCAMVVSGNALSDFASAPTWFADGMPNFVDTVDPTDRNYDSIGCGMAFLSWLISNPLHTVQYQGNATGLPLSTIARAMVSLGDGGTLAGLYYYLTLGAKANAWTNFQSALAALPAGVTSDDPFGALGPQPQPGPLPPPPVPPTPSPTPKVSGLEWAIMAMDAIMVDVSTGKTAADIKADVDDIPAK